MFGQRLEAHTKQKHSRGNFDSKNVIHFVKPRDEEKCQDIQISDVKYQENLFSCHRIFYYVYLNLQMKQIFVTSAYKNSYTQYHKPV